MIGPGQQAVQGVFVLQGGQADADGDGERAVELTHKAVLLKGPHTLVGEPGVPPWVVSEGHPALAIGGSGDDQEPG